MHLFQVTDSLGHDLPRRRPRPRRGRRTERSHRLRLDAGSAPRRRATTASTSRRWFDEPCRTAPPTRRRWADAARHRHGRAAGASRCRSTPPEVWGCGVTYRRSADFREEGLGIYDRIYEAAAARAVLQGVGLALGRPARADRPARATRRSPPPSPKSRVVVSRRGAILGYTLANDVSAWDIERDNPLYLPQSKIYDGCFSFGPTHRHARRDGRSVRARADLLDRRAAIAKCFAAPRRTGQLKRTLPGAGRLAAASRTPCPTGTVLSTGTGIIQPIETGLEPGDIVTITCPSLGTLKNPVALV